MSLRRALPLSATLLAWVVLLVGLLVLLGWALGIEPLKRPVPGTANMKANTSIAFAMAGGAMVLRQRGARARGPARVLAGLTALIGALTLVEYVARVDLGIDQALFADDPGGAGSVVAGRMAPMTAVCFGLFGCAVLLGSGRLATAMVAGIAVIAGLTVIAYLYSAQPLYGLAMHTHMAVHTSLTFLLCAAGLTLGDERSGVVDLLTREGLGGMVARRVLPAAVLVPVLVGWLRLLGQRAGLYQTEYGVSLLVACTILMLVAWLWFNARLLTRKEEQLRIVQAQLQQAQRLEVIGRLAGGVAHDFNNYLTPIIGYSSLVLDRLSPDDPARGEVEEIRRAAESAAGVTKQLLAFSRKQVLQPRVVDLNALVDESAKLLRRVIGETIRLDVRPGVALRRVTVDPIQFQQILMNLAVNAKDAMPRGGTLTIETANADLDPRYEGMHAGVTPGPYAVVIVTDTGIGMDRATLAHVFEPFFTTKAAGHGTGLGLATVHGIVQQSRGHVWVYSEPGRGTSFKIYFPETAERDAGRAPVRDAADMRGGTETVLVVEDDRRLRELAACILRGSGYTVLEARNGDDAVAASGSHAGPIDLIVSDVIMPGLSGREAVARITEKRPAVRVLYISGYSETAIQNNGVLDPGAELVEKPFTPERLLRRVRGVLDRRPA